jgi:phosphate-selective porin
VNWYLNRWMKVQANFIRERIDDPAQGPLPDRQVFWSRVVLFRFAM